MSNSTSDEAELIESRYGDVRQLPFPGQNQDAVPLAKVVSTDGRSRAWRVTLNRVNRLDGFAPIVQPSALNPQPLFRTQNFAYAAARILSQAVPPRRANPVFGSNNPSNQSLANVPDPLFVQLAWGMSVGSPNRMIGNWPLLGGSVVVEGSYVEVWGGGLAQSRGTPPITDGEWPVFAAQITPIDGVTPQDAGELSLTAGLPIANQSTTELAGLQLRGGLVGGLGGVDLSWQLSDLSGLQMGLQPKNVFSPEIVVSIFIATSPADDSTFELVDDAFVNTSGVLSFQAGSVAIIYVIGGDMATHTVTQLAALINSSALIQVGSVGSSGALVLTSGYVVGAGGGAPTQTGQAVGVLSFATAGAQAYVPDFARRVRIEVAQLQPAFAGLEYRVPITGPVACQIVWYADDGQVVFSEFQGKTSDAAGVQQGDTEENAWRAVPAQATTIGIYPDNAIDYTHWQAFVHWRVAP